MDRNAWRSSRGRRIGRYARYIERWRRSSFGGTPINRLMRKRHLDTLGIEGILDPAVHLTADPPLLNRFGLDPAFDDDGGIGKPIDSPHLQRVQDIVRKFRILPQFFRNVLQQ